MLAECQQCTKEYFALILQKQCIAVTINNPNIYRGKVGSESELSKVSEEMEKWKCKDVLILWPGLYSISCFLIFWMFKSVLNKAKYVK